MAFGVTWQSSDEAHARFSMNYPLGATDPTLIDQHIRSTREGFRERLDVDHFFTEDGNGNSSIDDSDNIGEHKHVMFNAPRATPTPAANKGMLYTKDFNSKAELTFTDEDAQELQITSAGKLLLSGEYALELNLSHTENVIKSDDLVITAAGIFRLPTDSTDTTEANLRYNTTDDTVEYRNASAWALLLASTGIGKVKVGNYSGDGGATQGITGVGFQADFVMILPDDASNQINIKTSTMDGTDSRSVLLGVSTDSIRSLDADGFTVGKGSTGGVANDDMNDSGTTYNYIAIKVLA